MDPNKRKQQLTEVRVGKDYIYILSQETSSPFKYKVTKALILGLVFEQSFYKVGFLLQYSNNRAEHDNCTMGYSEESSTYFFTEQEAINQAKSTIVKHLIKYEEIISKVRKEHYNLLNSVDN